MFTGIVKELGVVREMSKSGNIYSLTIEAKEISKTARIGDSIAVNGVCLTLTGKKERTISFDVMDETMRRTALNKLALMERVNLEDSLRPNDPLGGHFVLGHVDCPGKIVQIRSSGPEFVMEIAVPASFDDLVVEKGSVTVDGVSLTVGETKNGSFKIYLIPHTLKVTALGSRKPGDTVNIEFDILGKYVLKALVKKGGGSVISEDFLKEKGF